MKKYYYTTIYLPNWKIIAIYFLIIILFQILKGNILVAFIGPSNTLGIRSSVFARWSTIIYTPILATCSVLQRASFLEKEMAIRLKHSWIIMVFTCCFCICLVWNFWIILCSFFLMNSIFKICILNLVLFTNTLFWTFLFTFLSHVIAKKSCAPAIIIALHFTSFFLGSCFQKTEKFMPSMWGALARSKEYGGGVSAKYMIIANIAGIIIIFFLFWIYRIILKFKRKFETSKIRCK